MTTELKVIEEFMLPILKPSVINFEMIEDAYWQNIPKGEIERLKKLEPFTPQDVTEIALEFKNILKIDHLWIMPNLTKLSLNFNKIEKIENLEILINLKELDLSFNYIEKIENLNMLNNLEVLSLFSNKIKTIENLDNLENLIILNIGNNLIETVNGIERFRFMKKLYALNLEGNPITKIDEYYPFRFYIAAILPNLKYYEYIYIQNEERQKGTEKYRMELTKLERLEQDEIQMREKLSKERNDELKLSQTFVERLNEHQLFESFSNNDDQNNVLTFICSGIEEINKEYKIDVFHITQKIYKLGLDKYQERLKEIEMYDTCVKNGIVKTQNSGQKIIANFEEFKGQLFNEMITLQNFTEEENSQLNKQTIEDLEIKLNKKSDEVWRKIMEEESQLSESTEEVTNKFSENLIEQINNFIEEAQMYFVDLREITEIYSENLQEVVNSYLLICEKEDKIPKEIKLYAEDKNAITTLVKHIKANHVHKINDREDKLIEHARKWVQDFIEMKKESEHQRNRNKIKEINHILNTVKNEFNELKQKLQNEKKEN